MWGLRTPVAVWVVVGVLGQRSWANGDSLLQMRSFNIFDHHSNTTLQSIPLSLLQNKSTFLFGLARSGKPVFLQSTSSPLCKLPPDRLLCAIANVRTKEITIRFRRVTLADEHQQTLKDECVGEPRSELMNPVMRNSSGEDDETLNIKGKRKTTMIKCRFKEGDEFVLSSGYGFVSFQASELSREVWEEWQEGVAEVEGKAAQERTRTVIHVISGTAVMVVLVVVCVVCRLRSTPSTPYQARRRPSNTSGMRTGSTHDHP